jgi:hypothetical protein
MSKLGEPPRARHPRWMFWLKTAWVAMTVFAVGLGWQVNHIRQRRQFVQWIERRQQACGDAQVLVAPARAEHARIPFWRRWLGDQAFDEIYLPCDSTPTDEERAKALFPEAIVRWPLEAAS